MRHLVWIAVLVGFTQSMPLAQAQSYNGTRAGTYDAGPGGGPPPGYRADQPNPGNCGTPDDPRPCDGPVPRHPLKYYQGPRPSNG